MNWVEYWAQPGFDEDFRKKSLSYYVGNLITSATVRKGEDILDYGSGLGYVAEYLSERAGRLVLAEPSAALREASARFNAGRKNVVHVNPDGMDGLGAFLDRNRFDLILINSVIQYIRPDETRRILSLLRKGLKPGGRIVVSDIVPRDAQLIGDLHSVMGFYRRWFGLRRFLAHVAGEFSRLGRRRNLPFYTYTKQSFEASLRDEFLVQWIPNPTVCRGRLCAMLIPRT